MKIKVFAVCYEPSLIVNLENLVKKNFVSDEYLDFEIEIKLCRRIFHEKKSIKDRLKFNYSFYDDDFFDYSAYEDSLAMGKCNEFDGVIFINDTFLSKHHSLILLKEFLAKLNIARKVDAKIPVMIGPYENSQFTFPEPGLNEYVPTYLFFFNKVSFNKVYDILGEKNFIFEKFKNSQYESIDVNFWVTLIFYKSYLYDRSHDDLFLNRKLTTCYLEKLINLFFYKNGVILFATKSQKKLIFIDFEIKINNIIRKIKNIFNI